MVFGDVRLGRGVRQRNLGETPGWPGPVGREGGWQRILEGDSGERSYVRSHTKKTRSRHSGLRSPKTPVPSFWPPLRGGEGAR